MISKIFTIVYITLFFTLSIILYFVNNDTSEGRKDYKKSRRIMSFALFAVSLLGTIRTIVKPHHENLYTDHVILLGICYIFTFLNYLGFLYMIETASVRRQNVIKFGIIAFPIVGICASAGFIFPLHSLAAGITGACFCILIHFILLTWCLREYDKFIILINNYFDNYRNIRWIPFCLWFTFAVACITVGSMFFRPLTPVAGISSLFIYTFISMKLLSFVPEKIHTARVSYSNHEIVASDKLHNEEPSIMEIIPELDSEKTENQENKIEHQEYGPEKSMDSENSGNREKDINAERLEKRYEKVAALVEKWIETEKYVTPGINIKDVATQMGTNSNYLSTYINNVLGTSFALWLNSLRVEKSKEYLQSAQRISMEECGMKVGYESLYNYSRWFKTVTGMSPSQWKRNS